VTQDVWIKSGSPLHPCPMGARSSRRACDLAAVFLPLACAALLVARPVEAATYHVAQAGSDSASGTRPSPSPRSRTPRREARRAPPGSLRAMALPTTCSGRCWRSIPRASGSRTPRPGLCRFGRRVAPIRARSTFKVKQRSYAFDVQGLSYVDIAGFQIFRGRHTSPRDRSLPRGQRRFALRRPSA